MTCLRLKDGTSLALRRDSRLIQRKASTFQFVPICIRM